MSWYSKVCFRAERWTENRVKDKKNLLFVNKKKQKNFVNLDLERAGLGFCALNQIE